MRNRIILAGAIVALSISMSAQSAGNAEVFSSKDVHAKMAESAKQAQSSGSGGATFGDYKSHAIKFSARTKSGGAEVHQHFDDIMIVEKGSATLITGGTVVNPQTHADGEITGTGIAAGHVQTVSEGDIIHVPAGTPHQLMLRDGTDYRALVIKVRE